jgi:EAL domain-containing protein (putative c-di-GMP-specific phosphodiesterase class I)
MPAANLVLEVTETSLMIDPAQALRALKDLARRGIGISIDDYGTGYSSLRYLNDLPASELKIDRSFTAGVSSDERTAAIVAGTVELAHRLGMRLVAEGIEDEVSSLMMSRLGCDESQGFLHGRPLPADSFLRWLTAQRDTGLPVGADEG